MCAFKHNSVPQAQALSLPPASTLELWSHGLGEELSTPGLAVPSPLVVLTITLCGTPGGVSKGPGSKGSRSNTSYGEIRHPPRFPDRARRAPGWWCSKGPAGSQGGYLGAMLQPELVYVAPRV